MTSVLTATLWDESKHPREPGGSTGGGRFVTLAEVMDPAVRLGLVEAGDHGQLTRLAEEAQAASERADSAGQATDDPQSVAILSLQRRGMAEEAVKLKEAASVARLQADMTVPEPGGVSWLETPVSEGHAGQARVPWIYSKDTNHLWVGSPGSDHTWVSEVMRGQGDEHINGEWSGVWIPGKSVRIHSDEQGREPDIAQVINPVPPQVIDSLKRHLKDQVMFVDEGTVQDLTAAAVLPVEAFNRRVAAGTAAAWEKLPALERVYARLLKDGLADAADRFMAQVHEHDVTASAWVPPDPNELTNTGELADSVEQQTAKVRKKQLQALLVQLDLDFEITNPFALELLDQLGRFAARLLVPGLQQAVAAAVAQGYEEGLSVPNTAALIRDAGVKSRAEMMARTDLTGLTNGASVAAARAVYPDGTVLKRWMSAHDDRVRPDHVEADGQTVPIEQPFLVGADELMFPGDPLGSDGETCNCRCTTIYVPVEAVTAAAVTEFKGSMVALPVDLELAKKLAIPGGQEPETFHVTLAFLPGEADLEAVQRAVDQVAGDLPIEGTISGVGEFAPGEDGTPVILIPNAAGLVEMREKLVEALTAEGVEWSDKYEFQPHITVAYVNGEKPDLSDAIGTKLTFNTVEHKDGDLVHHEVTAAGWDESLHPRDPGGEGGGQFVTGSQTGAAELARLMAPHSEGVSINAYWDPSARYNTKEQRTEGDWKLKPPEQWRSYRPDEPHVYADSWPESFSGWEDTHPGESVVEDTSPPNPRVTGLANGIKMWIRGKGRDAFPWFREMRAQFAEDMGWAEPDEPSSYMEHMLPPLEHEVATATASLAEGIRRGGPQPALWRGLGSDDVPGWTQAVLAAEPGDTLRMLPASWSRDYARASSYAGAYGDKRGVMLYALPGSNGVADKARLLSDEEVITAGDFEVVSKGDIDVPVQKFTGDTVQRYTVVTVKQTSGAASLTAAVWEESEHPRDPGGEGGGQFVSSNQVSAVPKQSARDQKVPEIYLSESGSFKSGWDARYKSDLVNSVMGFATKDHTFEVDDALRRLEERGWTKFLEQKEKTLGLQIHYKRPDGFWDAGSATVEVTPEFAKRVDELKGEMRTIGPLEGPNVTYREGLNVNGIRYGKVAESVRELGLLDEQYPGLLANTTAKGVTVWAGPGNGIDQDDLGYLRTERARGWGGNSTLKQVPGFYTPITKQVAVGTGGRKATQSLMIHEFAHAAGDVFGVDDNPELTFHHRQLYPLLGNYFKQGGPGGRAGRQELWAETVAALVKTDAGEFNPREGFPWQRTEIPAEVDALESWSNWVRAKLKEKAAEQ